MLAILFLGSCFCAEEPDAVFKQGLAKLRDAQADHSALVPATKLLAQAAALYEAAGNEAQTAEVNACLYWAKKRLTLADTNILKPDMVATRKLEGATKVRDDSGAMLQAADQFGAKSQDNLLVAIRYFEVADRFPELPEGRKAMSASLAAMAKVGTEKLAIYRPTSADGKAFIQSEPTGASILIVTDEGRKDTGKKTPSLIDLPKGGSTVELTLKGFKTLRTSLAVTDTISKPDKLDLVPLTIPIDILYDPGWGIFVDGKATDLETPSSIEMPLGRHEVMLAKENFVDVRQGAEVTETGLRIGSGLPVYALEIKATPKPGVSLLLKLLAETRVELAYSEIMGYSSGKLQSGANMYTNHPGNWANIPKEIEGKQYTLVVANTVSPVMVEFRSAGKAYFIPHWQLPQQRPVLAKYGKKENYTLGGYEVWSIQGRPGMKVSFPTQIVLIADKLTKAEIKTDVKRP
jgi:hypothetical protein